MKYGGNPFMSFRDSVRITIRIGERPCQILEFFPRKPKISLHGKFRLRFQGRYRHLIDRHTGKTAQRQAHLSRSRSNQSKRLFRNAGFYSSNGSCHFFFPQPCFTVILLSNRRWIRHSKDIFIGSEIRRDDLCPPLALSGGKPCRPPLSITPKNAVQGSGTFG